MTANEMIGSSLSDELLKRNMTPSTMAASIGISQHEIENVCNGIYADTFVVGILSKALNCNLFKTVIDNLEQELKN